MRKYLNYIVFAAVALFVIGLAVSHSRRLRSLVDAMSGANASVRSEAAAELIKSEQFMDAITGETVEARLKAAEALELLGNKAAVSQALPLLKDQDKAVRDRAVQTLQKIAGASPENLKALLNGLKDGDGNVRKGVVRVLTEAGKGVGPLPSVVSTVVDYMKADINARSVGGDILGASLFSPRANDESLPLLYKILEDKDEAVRASAAEALGKVGDKRAVPILTEKMKKDTAQLRRVSISAIALIADPSGEAQLTEAVRNPEDDDESRAQAASGLGKIGTPTAIDTLLVALDDNDLKLRSAASAALARAGRPSRAGASVPMVVSKCNAALKSPSENVRLGVAQALQGIAAPEANAALLEIVNGAQHSDSLRTAATLALGFPSNKAAVEPLVRLLNDKNAETLADAAKDALSGIGADAVPALIAVFSQDNAAAYHAAAALAKMGASTLPALQQAAKSANTAVQRWAAVALGEMGVAEARQTLQTLASSADPDLAYVAKEQLNRTRNQ